MRIFDTWAVEPITLDKRDDIDAEVWNQLETILISYQNATSDGVTVKVHVRCGINAGCVKVNLNMLRRLCFEYRDLNMRIVRVQYSLPNIQNQINSLNKAKYFASLDVLSGFQEVEIDSQWYTTYIASDGLCEYVLWKRERFCYLSTSNWQVLSALKGTKVFVYLNDVMVASGNVLEGFKLLNEICKRYQNPDFR